MVEDGRLQIASMKGCCSEPEWRSRVDLAACYRLELSCRAQLAAMACNTPLAKVEPQILEETWANYQSGTRRPYGLMEWPALLRKLDRLDPSYKT